MSKVLIIALVGFVVFGGSCLMTVMGVNNQCVAQENGIDAQYDSNKVALAGYANKIMDMVQVPKMAKDHIVEITKAAIQGRYGENGAQAVFQAVKEQNPTVDNGLYRTLMQSMEAGRNGFDADQKVLLDKCRVYKTYYQQFPNSLVAGFIGFPKFDQTKCKPVTTEQTETDFRNKTTGPLKLQ